MKRLTLHPGLYFVELPPKLIIDNGHLRGQVNCRWLEVKDEEMDVDLPPAAVVERVDYAYLGFKKEECKRMWEDDRLFRLNMKVEELTNALKEQLQ